MSLMHAYGKCSRCNERGALWRFTFLRKRWVFFGALVERSCLMCDECCQREIVRGPK